MQHKLNKLTKSETSKQENIWDKIFKNGPSKIFYRLSSTNFTGPILEYFVPYKQTTNQYTFFQVINSVSDYVVNYI